MPKPPPPRRPGGLPPRRSIDELLAEGLRHHQSGAPDAAAKLYRQVLSRAPDQPAANHLLGVVHLQKGEAEEAVRLISRATRSRDTDPQYFANLGVALNMLGRHAEAVAAFDRAVALNPRFAAAWSNRGMALKQIGRSEDAAESYRRAIGLSPSEPGMYANLGNALNEAGEFTAAEQALRAALELRPFHVNATVALCQTLESTARTPAAEELARAAVAAIPTEPQFHYRHGRALNILRRPAEAAEALRAAIRLKPDYGIAHYQLAETVYHHTEDADITALRTLSVAPDMPGEERIFANYGLGRALSDLGQHEESIAAFTTAHRLRRDLSSESVEDEIVALRRRIEQFDTLPESLRNAATSDFAPVFVIGLPRAGKSTVEAILETQPGFVGVGEQTTMQRLVARASALNGEDLTKWTPRAVADLGESYAAEIRPLIPEGARPVDTLPPNFALIGFIRLALPKATIIHCTRDRADHCIALCEKYITGRGYAYTTAAADLVRYYDAYLMLMAAWRLHFPGTILDADISESSSLTAILDRCGLQSAPRPELPQTEPRVGAPEPEEAAANRNVHRNAWRKVHPELFEA